MTKRMFTLDSEDPNCLPPMTSNEAESVRSFLQKLSTDGPIISLTSDERALQQHADEADDNGEFWCAKCGEYAVQGRSAVCPDAEPKLPA